MNPSLKILCPTYWYPRTPEDTQATYVHDINRHLVKLGHQVIVVTPTQETVTKTETFDGVTVVRFPCSLPDSLLYGHVAQSKVRPMEKIGRLIAIGNYLRLQYTSGMKAANQYGVDLVHAHWAIPTGPSAVTIAKRLSVPSIITMHGGDVYVNESQGYDFPSRWYVRPLLKYVFQSVSALTAISRDCREHALAVGADDEKIHLVFNGADLKRFSPRPETQEFPGEYGQHMIFACRQLFPRKGIAILLQAAAIVRKSVPDIRVVIAGDGFQRAELEKLAEELSISDITEFLGWVPNKDLPKYYRAAVVSVIPSLEEGFGIPAAEAMGCKLPVIASDAGGLPEVVDDGVTGFVVPKGDVDALAEKLILLLGDPDLREKMGTAGFNKAMARFSWTKTATQFADLFYEQFDRKGRVT